jgi:hypothetical protein
VCCAGFTLKTKEKNGKWGEVKGKSTPHVVDSLAKIRKKKKKDTGGFTGANTHHVVDWWRRTSPSKSRGGEGKGKNGETTHLTSLVRDDPLSSQQTDWQVCYEK